MHSLSPAPLSKVRPITKASVKTEDGGTSSVFNLSIAQSPYVKSYDQKATGNPINSGSFLPALLLRIF